MQDRFLEIVIRKGLLGLLSCNENENWKYLSVAGRKHSRCTVVSSSREAYDPKFGGDLEEVSSDGCILPEVL
jgi:hypothetical protein